MVAAVVPAILTTVAMATVTVWTWTLPAFFPEPRIPQANPMTAEKVELGRHLFFDQRLSGNGTQSCASCHEPSRAFTDGRRLAVGNWPSPPLNLRRKMLFEEQMVCLARRNHPHVKPPALDLRTYLELGHVAPEPYLASHVPGPVDGAVAMLGFKRAIKATIPDFNLAGQMVAATDLVFTCCRQFGDYYARTLDLEMVEAPPEFPPMRFYMLWHDRTQLDPAISWLREQVESVAREFGQPVQR